MESVISGRMMVVIRNIIKKSKFERRHYMYRSSSYLNSKVPCHCSIFESPASRQTSLKPHLFISNNTNRLLHSLQVHNVEEEEADGPVNEFLERFVAVMRSKLSQAYPDAKAEIVDDMLEIIVNKIVEEMEKGSFSKFKDFASKVESESGELSEELWKIVWEVSSGIVEDMQKAQLNREIHSYLHSEEVKEISTFAKDAGITGDLLRDLKMHFVQQKKSEIEFYRNLDRLAGRDSTTNLIGSGVSGLKFTSNSKKQSSLDEGEGEREEKSRRGLPERRGKLKFEPYGLDLSDSSWTEISQRLEVAEKKITLEGPVVLTGKGKAMTKEILSLSDDEDLSHLLTQWMEIVNPRRVDWLALLQQLNKSKKNLFFKAMEFALNEGSFEASVRDYTKLLDAYAKENRFQEAERVLQTMAEKGFARDALTCSVLIHMYSKLGYIDRAREAFDEIRSLGLQPDQKAYSLMIMAYVKAGLPKAGESLMREMEAKDIKPGKEVYLALLRAFAHRGHVDGAQRIFNTMQFANIMPNLESCTLLVEAYGRSGDPDQARSVFDNMMKAGHKPDDKCTSSMIAAYEKKNYLDKALNLLLDLEKDGFKPGVETSAILIDWLGKLGLVDEAEQAFEEIATNEVPSKVYVSLCDMYVRAGLHKKALDTLGILESNIENLDSEGFERLIHGLLSGGLIEEAQKMQEFMQNQGFVPSEPLRVALMAAQAVPRRKPTGR